MLPDNKPCLGVLPAGRVEIDLQYMRNETLVIHTVVAIARMPLFQSQIAILSGLDP
jgi:hypothetical protein